MKVREAERSVAGAAAWDEVPWAEVAGSLVALSGQGLFKARWRIVPGQVPGDYELAAPFWMPDEDDTLLPGIARVVWSDGATTGVAGWVYTWGMQQRSAPWYPLSGGPAEYVTALQEAEQWVEGLGALFVV